jgi:hypothetical protein
MRTAAAYAAILAALVGACRARPAAGGKCDLATGSAPLVCETPGRALVCESGTWSQVPCGGAAGCEVHGDTSHCDDTVAAEGDACPPELPVDYACTADHAEALVCEGGHFALWRHCRGAEGCRVTEGRNVYCDTMAGEPGDPCVPPTYTCSSDKTLLLRCDGTTLHAASSCRGPAGCSAERESRKAACDDAVALAGDPCDLPKRISCTVDGKAELMCSDGKYQPKRECRRSPCHLEGTELFCD